MYNKLILLDYKLLAITFNADYVLVGPLDMHWVRERLSSGLTVRYYRFKPTSTHTIVLKEEQEHSDKLAPYDIDAFTSIMGAFENILVRYGLMDSNLPNDFEEALRRVATFGDSISLYSYGGLKVCYRLTYDNQLVGDSIDDYLSDD